MHNGPFNEPASFDIPELIFQAKVTKFGIKVGLNMLINMNSVFYPRPVLAFGYCHRLRLWVCVCVYQSRACPHDNSSPSQARITKFGPEMQNTLVWVPIVFGDDRL